MKAIHNIFAINISIALLIVILFGLLIQFPYPIPLMLGGFALVNFALAGVFFLGDDPKLGLAFALGGLMLVLFAGGYYGYMHFYTPEKINYMKDLADPQK